MSVTRCYNCPKVEQENLELKARAERDERIVAAVEALIPKWQRRYEREAGGFDIAGSVAATTSTCLNELNDALNTQERT